jgi:hypothetical protein
MSCIEAMGALIRVDAESGPDRYLFMKNYLVTTGAF